MNHAASHQGHMWLIGGATVVALLLGWSVGFALAFLLVACGAMLGAIFWIGRTSAQEQRIRISDHRDDVPHQ